jgi:hypothetical protein
LIKKGFRYVPYEIEIKNFDLRFFRVRIKQDDMPKPPNPKPSDSYAKGFLYDIHESRAKLITK